MKMVFPSRSHTYIYMSIMHKPPATLAIPAGAVITEQLLLCHTTQPKSSYHALTEGGALLKYETR